MASCRFGSSSYCESFIWSQLRPAQQRCFSSGVPAAAGALGSTPDGNTDASALHSAAQSTAETNPVLDLASGALDPAAAVLEGAWPNVALAVRAVDSLHSATGLPWWATLSLGALGERPPASLSAPPPPAHLRHWPAVADSGRRLNCGV